MSLLVCEDDSSVGRLLQRGLRQAGFEVDWVQRGCDGLQLAARRRYQAVILDLMLPDIDGLTVCRRLRERDARVPILMLTARDEVEQKVEGFAAGADDYLTKPFAFEELIARIGALLRRNAEARIDGIIEHGGLRVDRESREVSCRGRTIDLTEREFQLLCSLMEKAGKVISRERLIQSVWGVDADVSDNAVDVYIGYLRKKLETDSDRRLIRTVRGVGFKLDLQASAS